MNKYNSVEKSIKSFNKADRKERKEHPIKYYLSKIYYRVINFLEDIPRYTKSFLQRGKRGYANSDVWGLGYYLSDIIEHSVGDLKKNLNGHPTELSEGQWVDILNSISYTFYLAKKCSAGDLALIRDKKDREKFNKIFKERNVIRCMNLKEIRAYDLGWKNFKEYFFSLWD